jgi:alkylhydroperoxidase/carboxymuconolactone decarboxylase family protein YurZ
MKKHASAVEHSASVPKSWRRFTERYPDLAAAYDVLSDVCRDSGPLDVQTVALVKLAISVGCHAQRTVHAHAKKALRLDVNPEALRHIARIALPTVGLPASLDALAWIEESIRETSA